MAAPDPPGVTFCENASDCQVWAYIPAGTTFTLRDNNVTGAQINYLVGGIQFDGTFIQNGNQSNSPRDSDWEGANGCGLGGIFRTWTTLDFAAFSPVLEGWTEFEVYCER